MSEGETRGEGGTWHDYAKDMVDASDMKFVPMDRIRAHGTRTILII
jgi:hypothetical protein